MRPHPAAARTAARTAARIAADIADRIAADVAAAVAGRDPLRLAAALTQTVRLRALLPAGPIEAHGRDDVAARFHGWFTDFDTVQVIDSAGEPVADRLLIHYRLHLTKTAPATTRWVCTQTAVCKLVDDRLAVINLLCSGFREIGDHDYHDDHEHDDEHDEHDLPASSGARLLG
jgi:hypothetical protein